MIGSSVANPNCHFYALIANELRCEEQSSPDKG